MKYFSLATLIVYLCKFKLIQIEIFNIYFERAHVIPALLTIKFQKQQFHAFSVQFLHDYVPKQLEPTNKKIPVNDEKLELFRKKLQHSLGSNTTGSSTVPNKQQLRQNVNGAALNNNQQKPSQVKTTSHETVYITRDYIPVEQNYNYKPDKDRGYGCSNCSIF